MSSGEDITERKKIEEALKESEEKYRLIVENANNAIMVTSPDKKISYLSPSAKKVLGFAPEELIGKVPNLALPEDKSKVQAELKKSLNSKGSGNIEYCIKTKDKKIKCISHSWKTIVENGDVKKVVSVIKDITEKKNHEDKLKDSEEKYRVLYESSMDAIVTLEPPKWNFADGNKGAIKMFGAKDKKDLTSRPPWQYSPLKQPDGQLSSIKAKKMINLAMKNGYNFFEWTHKSIDGKEFFASVLLVKIKLKNKEFLQATVRDITDLKTTALKLKRERDRAFRDREHINTIIKNIGDGVFVVDKDFKITIINKVACALSGYSAKYAIGRKYTDIFNFINEKSRKINDEFIKIAINNGKISDMANHTILVRKDKSEIFVSDSAAPIKNEQGNVIGCVIVFRDVTKERKIDQSKTEFVSVASHQLRTPLTGIKWFLEILMSEKAGKLNDKQKDFIKQVDESNERMISLVSDLLNVSRIETGKKFDIVKTDVNIIKILNSILQDIALVAKERGIKIVGCGLDPKKKLIVRADADHIRQVFYNLINNAIKYSNKDGVVEIGCSHNNDFAEFFIKDSGVGIPISQQKKVFEKFFRADNIITKETSGTGLGLYIAKAVVESHGGKIWFESEENKGTTFYFTIPKK